MSKKEEIITRADDYKFTPSAPAVRPGEHVWVVCEGRVREALVESIEYKYKSTEWDNWKSCKIIEEWEYKLNDTYNDDKTNIRPDWKMFKSKKALKDYLFKDGD